MTSKTKRELSRDALRCAFGRFQYRDDLSYLIFCVEKKNIFSEEYRQLLVTIEGPLRNSPMEFQTFLEQGRAATNSREEELLDDLEGRAIFYGFDQEMFRLLSLAQAPELERLASEMASGQILDRQALEQRLADVIDQLPANKFISFETKRKNYSNKS